MKTILFVCTGNSCRSVMAEGLLKKMLGLHGHQFYVHSAGIEAVDGFPSTPATIKALKEEGVDVSTHRSRRLTLEMIKTAHKIYVMEHLHMDWVLRMCPEAKHKTHLLSEFSSEHEKETIGIPDPIRMSDNFYKNVLIAIRGCVENLVITLVKETKAKA